MNNILNIVYKINNELRQSKHIECESPFYTDRDVDIWSVLWIFHRIWSGKSHII